MENAKIKVIELFAGIGAVHTALSRLGIDYEMVDVVEFDRKVIEAYNLIHGTNFEAQNVCEKIVQIEEGTIRYRVLTPRECFRLMNFSDEQFDKVKHFSTSRLTKLAGNSIVVKCIEEILRKFVPI